MVAVGKIPGDLGEASVDRRAVCFVADYLADQCQEAVLAGDDAALGFAFAGDVAGGYPVERGVQRDLGLDGQVLCAGQSVSPLAGCDFIWSSTVATRSGGS